MNGNAELLNFIYQNSQMGVDTVNQLIDITEDEEFKVHLRSELEEYREINTAAQGLLNTNGYDEKGISAFDKIKTYLMINMQTMMDSTTSHIAEMLIIGSNMGVIDAIRNIKKYQDAEKDIVALMKKLLKFEENNIKQLKSFV
ncbi:MAG TPA: hypothetical protein GX707_16175 [Epulopiscium sp.]|nr:hypothetical protein [Candidatus Epulonipiscium sp.]